MSRRESTSVPSRSHKIVVMLVISPRATFFPPCLLLDCRIKDYTHTIASRS